MLMQITANFVLSAIVSSFDLSVSRCRYVEHTIIVLQRRLETQSARSCQLLRCGYGTPPES